MQQNLKSGFLLEICELERRGSLGVGECVVGYITSLCTAECDLYVDEAFLSPFVLSFFPNLGSVLINC